MHSRGICRSGKWSKIWFGEIIDVLFETGCVNEKKQKSYANSISSILIIQKQVIRKEI